MKKRTSTIKHKKIIEIMPDVEGCWNKIVSFMKKSSIFNINGKQIDDTLSPEQYNQITMIPNSYFVCLGDTIDNGPNNLSILRLLRHLKLKYNKRVIFIIGNRDINKIRLKFELEKQRTGINRLTKSEYPINESKVNKLKWILTNTMGCPNTFEYFKQELNTNDDNIVLDKFIEILEIPENHDSDRGLLLFYLYHANLVYYNKSTKSIYMHGGLNCKNYLTLRSKKFKNLKEWIFNLNKWYHDLLRKAYIQNIDESEIEELLLYQDERDYTKKDGYGGIYSVVISRPWKTPPITNGSIGSSLIEEGCFDSIYKDIRYIFTGHTPVGQLPVIYKLFKNRKKITFIFGDTTYSGKIANIKFINGHVYIKADYLNNHKLDSTCSKESVDYIIEYSSKDKNIGTEKDGKFILAKNGTEYIYGQWDLNRENPTMLKVINK